MQHSNLTFNQVYVLGNLLVLEQIKFDPELKRKRSSRKDKAQLKKIQAGLKRIEQGIYGMCVDCCRPLSYAFLLKNPARDLCRECQGPHRISVAA